MCCFSMPHIVNLDIKGGNILLQEIVTSRLVNYLQYIVLWDTWRSDFQSDFANLKRINKIYTDKQYILPLCCRSIYLYITQKCVICVTQFSSGFFVRRHFPNLR